MPVKTIRKTAAPKKAAPKTPRAKKAAAVPKKVSAATSPAATRAPKKTKLKTQNSKLKTKLPEAYGTGRLFLVARDPRWLYAHWDISGEEQRAFKAELVLRVHRDSNSGKLVSETKLPADARHWFLPVARGETRYVAELGYTHSRGGWVAIATSDAVVTPSESLAPEMTALFATIPQNVPFRKVLETIGAAVAKNISLIEIVRQFRSELPGFDVSPAEQNWTAPQMRELSRIAGVRQIRSRLVRELASLTAANILTSEIETTAETSIGKSLEEDFAPSSWSSWSGGLN